MRIGLFTDQFSLGISGQTTSVTMLYDYFKQTGNECYIFTSHSSKLIDNNSDIVNLTGIPYPLKHMRKYRFSPFIKRQVKIVASYKLDIIHVHTEYFLADVALAAKKSWVFPWFTPCTPCGNIISTISLSRLTPLHTRRSGDSRGVLSFRNWHTAQI